MASYDDKIRELEEEIRNTQYNKATQHHIGLVKAKIAALREKKEAKGRGGGGFGYSVRKSGDSTVVLVGFPSVGKSTILNKITNAESKVGAYAFTTLTVVPGIMEYNHAKIQVLDVPGLVKGAASGAGMGKEVLAVLRNADLIVMVTEPFSLGQIEVLRKELHDAGIRLDASPPNVRIRKKDRGGIDFASTVRLTKTDRKTIEGVMREFGLDNASIVVREDITAEQLIDAIIGNRVYVSSLVVINKADTANERQLAEARKKYSDAFVASAEKESLDALKPLIFGKLRLMRVFLKEAGKKADMDVPLIIREGSTIRDVCDRLHRDFAKRFRNAKVWGKSAKFPGQVFKDAHVLMDSDVLQISLR